MSACSVLELPAKPFRSKPPKVSVFIEKRSDFHFTVAARSDRKHAWRNHFKSDSIAHRVMSRWEHLAAMNHGFVYEGTANTAKHSGHYREDDAPCREVVQRIKKFCRAKGIISDDCWGTNQWGHQVLGFWLVNHAEFCTEKDHRHCYWRPLNDAIRRARFHPYEVAPESPSSRGKVAPESQPSRNEVAVKSPQIDFKVAAKGTFQVAPVSPQETVKAEDTGKSSCVGFRQDGDLVGGSVLNVLNSLNVKSERSVLNLVNPAQESVPSGSKSESKTLALSSQAKTEPQEKANPINSDDVTAIQALCQRLCDKKGTKEFGFGKPPAWADVEKFLRKYPRDVIEDALTYYVEYLPPKDIPWVEKKFFKDGAGFGAILLQLQNLWKDDIQYYIDAENWDDISVFDPLDVWLAENPIPVGLEMKGSDLINKARKNERRIAQEHFSTNKRCPYCDGDSIFCENGIWKCRSCAGT